jgi:endonuclease/exonuclease/phosphatase family metal-dependent hydrolase
MKGLFIKSSYRLKLLLPVVMLSFFFACQENKEQSTDTGTTFRLITHNVWYGFTQVPERKDPWLQWMKEQAPDVVSLQELNEYTAEKLAGDARFWGHPYSVLLKEEGFPTGITSRYPIEDIRRYREGFHHGLIRVRIKGIYFYVIHLHPSNWEMRGREVDLILEDIRELPRDARIILAGDFNTFSPVDSVYYQNEQLVPFFQARDEAYQEKNLRKGQLDYSVIGKLMGNGLVDVEYRMRTDDYRFTGSFPTRVEKEGDDGDPRRLDYVFVSRNLADQVLDAQIIANDTTWILSDHLPVRVDFRLK